MDRNQGTPIYSGQVPSNIYCLEARLSEERGDGPAVTEEYYDKALETAQSVTDRLHVRLYYGKYLVSAGRYGEALNVLGSGLRLADARNMRIYKYRFYGQMSEAYEGVGDYVRALDYYRKFQKEYNDVYSIEKERAISELSRKYENEHHELEMMKKSRELRTVLLFASLEKTMKEGRAYREAGLTGDRLAKLAGTNRTYLSKVVNEMTGMTPAKYREKIIYLSKKSI